MLIKERGSKEKFVTGMALSQISPSTLFLCTGSCTCVAERTYRTITPAHPQVCFSRRMIMLWEIDATNSQVSFAIRVLSVTMTRGHFNTLRGHLHIDEQHPTNSW